MLRFYGSCVPFFPSNFLVWREVFRNFIAETVRFLLTEHVSTVIVRYVPLTERLTSKMSYESSISKFSLLIRSEQNSFLCFRLQRFPPALEFPILMKPWQVKRSGCSREEITAMIWSIPTFMNSKCALKVYRWYDIKAKRGVQRNNFAFAKAT